VQLRASSRRRERRPQPETMTLVEHLAELRSRIIKVLIAIAVGAVVGFLVHPYCDVKQSFQPGSTCKLVVTDPLESFSIRLKLAGYMGLLFASPVVLWQLWRFITPGLNKNERKYAVPFVISGVSLFALGAVIALVTFPEALRFLVQVGGDSVEPFYTPGKYISLIIFMMLAFGAGFEFPVLLVFLQLAGILQWRQLAGWWRYAVIVIFFVDAVITPSQDPISLLALGIPMTVFYGASILIGRMIQRDRVRS